VRVKGALRPQPWETRYGSLISLRVEGIGTYLIDSITVLCRIGFSERLCVKTHEAFIFYFILFYFRLTTSRFQNYVFSMKTLFHHSKFLALLFQKSNKNFRATFCFELDFFLDKFLNSSYRSQTVKICF